MNSLRHCVFDVLQVLAAQISAERYNKTMNITIENPTAEAAYAALQQLPNAELLRLKTMFDQRVDETAEQEETAWREISHHSAVRFFEEEEIS